MAAATPLFKVPYITHLLGFWLIPIFLLILFTAAFLHWQRARHWCLLALAIGALLMALGTIAARVGEMPLHGHTVEAIASGLVQPIRTDAEISVAFRSAKERGFRGAKGDNPTDIDSPVLSG